MLRCNFDEACRWKTRRPTPMAVISKRRKNSSMFPRVWCHRTILSWAARWIRFACVYANISCYPNTIRTLLDRPTKAISIGGKQRRDFGRFSNESSPRNTNRRKVSHRSYRTKKISLKISNIVNDEEDEMPFVSASIDSVTTNNWRYSPPSPTKFSSNSIWCFQPSNFNSISKWIKISRFVPFSSASIEKRIEKKRKNRFSFHIDWWNWRRNPRRRNTFSDVSLSNVNNESAGSKHREKENVSFFFFFHIDVNKRNSLKRKESCISSVPF